MDEQTALDHHLDTLKEQVGHPWKMDTTDRDAFLDWQARTRLDLFRLAGMEPDFPPNPLTTEKVGSVSRGGLQQEKWYLQDSEGVVIPVYHLAHRAGPPKRGRILVFHGHNPNVQYCLGNYPDPETEARMRAKDNPYAEGLALAGWDVFAVEQRGFGERQTARRAPLHDGSIQSSCRDLSIQYASMGRTVIGERVRDARTVLGWLLERGSGPVVVTGNSGGGTTALWHAALDDRVAGCITGSYFCTFRDSILAMPHCDCNYVPGLFAKLEMADLAALIAPRPFCALHGRDDPIFPIRGTREAFRRLKTAYSVLQADGLCRLSEHPGGHAYSIRAAVEFLEGRLLSGRS
jgi:pimeloyl-ACP methyl ester carboxylesterase